MNYTLFDIGFTGFAGAGKDTAANAVFNSELRYTRQAFADAVKAIARTVGWDGEKDLRGRTLLQDIGMCVRDYDKDAWVKLVEQLLPTAAAKEHVLWTDVRFGNEADFIRKRGGIIIEVRRHNNPRTPHISEVSHLEITPDYITHNDSTIKALHEEMLAIVAMEQRLRIDRALFGSEHEQK
jgi:hypothetical protein